MRVFESLGFLALCCILTQVRSCKSSKSTQRTGRSNNDITYTKPNGKGYCSIDNMGRRHEHCRCTDKNKGIGNCKQKCDQDSKCKGYSFRPQKSRCYLYTTSPCNSQCTKRDNGNLGNLISKKDDGESGCFVKITSKNSNTQTKTQSRPKPKKTPNSRPNKTPLRLSDNDLKTISEELLRLDENNVAKDIQINAQGKTRSGNFNDRAPDPLFTRVDNKVWRIRSFKALQALLDNYDPNVKNSEDNTRAERQEEEEFLTSVMETKVMKRAYQFLVEYGKFTGSMNDFRAYLKRIWFEMYDRDGNNRKTTIGSSGFEHVFIGEIKNNDVSGFHNWVSFYQKEKSSNGRRSGVNYLGHVIKKNFGNSGTLITNVFTWNGASKKIGSMFVGTSPELEMALYTICFVVKKEETCKMTLKNVPIQIKTHKMTQRNFDYIGTAFP